MSKRNIKNQFDAYQQRQERKSANLVVENRQKILNRASPQCRAVAGMLIKAKPELIDEVVSVLKEMFH